MQYEAPDTIEAAVSLLSGDPDNSWVLSGGTDLLVQLRSDIVEPGLIVDIKKIAETRTISEEAGGFRVGAAVTGAELTDHPDIAKKFQALLRQLS